MSIAPPFLVSYSITSKCNLSCKHCYSESTDKSGADDLTKEECLKVIDDLIGWGIKLIVFDGGEPLYREDFFDIAQYSTKKGLRVAVGSNGTMIDKKIAKKMLNIGISSVAISIDGANAKTHDSFRGENGAFNNALKGAKACKDAGLPFQFNMVIRKSTLNQIPRMLDLAVKSGANAAEFFDLVLAGRAKKECPDEELNINERQKIMEWLANAQIDCPIVIRVPACPMYPLILKEKKIKPNHIPMNLLERIPYYNRGCAAGMPNGYITIRSNGDVNPCMLLQTNPGNVKEKNIRDIWENNPLLKKLRDRSLLKGHCGNCEYKADCAGCRGRAYEKTGDIFASDPGCWLKS